MLETIYDLLKQEDKEVVLEFRIDKYTESLLFRMKWPTIEKGLPVEYRKDTLISEEVLKDAIDGFVEKKMTIEFEDFIKSLKEK